MSAPFLSECDLFARANGTGGGGNARTLPPLLPSAHKVTDPIKIYHVKREVSRAWGLRSVRKHNPSPNPVSIERKDLRLLVDKEYVAAEKSDGVQYLLLLGRWPPAVCGGVPFALMVNRNYDVYEVRVSAQSQFFNEGSLFIGELVWEFDSRARDRPRQLFLVFEAVRVAGKRLTQVEDYVERYKTIDSLFSTAEHDILDNPRKWEDTAGKLALRGKIVSEGNKHALAFRLKRCMPVKRLETLWANVRSCLRHSTDGLIFTPVRHGVGTGTQPNLFKWKPHHTVDFEVDAKKLGEGDWEYRIFYRNKGARVDGAVRGVSIRVPRGVPTDPSADAFDDVDPAQEPVFRTLPLVLMPNDYLDSVTDHYVARGDDEFSVVMECSCRMPNIEEWMRASDEDDMPMVECEAVKVRADKGTANDAYTIDRTLLNIEENITIQELCALTRNPAIQF